MLTTVYCVIRDSGYTPINWLYRIVVSVVKLNNAYPGVYIVAFMGSRSSVVINYRPRLVLFEGHFTILRKRATKNVFTGRSPFYAEFYQ